MKKALSVIFVILCLLYASCSAEAQSETADEIRSVMASEGYSGLVQLQTRGDSAACFADKDGIKYLCMLEKKNTVWKLLISNADALYQELDYPFLQLDSDQAVFWVYQISQWGMMFHSGRAPGQDWNEVDLTLTEQISEDRINVYLIEWRPDHGGEIACCKRTENENEMLIGEESMQYLPAPGMETSVMLAEFDVMALSSAISGLDLFSADLVPDAFCP